MTEEGTLSIVRRGQRYLVRYATNNPHGRDRQPRECPDEAHLATLLAHLGVAEADITLARTEARTRGMAVLRIILAAEQLQAFFRLAA